MTTPTCKLCDDTGFIIRRLFEPRSRLGFRQDAVKCDHKPIPRVTGKMAAANDTAHDTSYMTEMTY